MAQGGKIQGKRCQPEYARPLYGPADRAGSMAQILSVNLEHNSEERVGGRSLYENTKHVVEAWPHFI